MVHERDGRQTEHGAHLAVVLGPRAAHDVEHGGAHGVADVEQLIGATLRQDQIDHGRDVVVTHLMEAVGHNNHSVLCLH